MHTVEKHRIPPRIQVASPEERHRWLQGLVPKRARNVQVWTSELMIEPAIRLAYDWDVPQQPRKIARRASRGHF